MIQTGLNNLLTNQMGLLSGRRVGLVSHAAAVMPDLTGIVDAMLAAGVKLAALFGPEHGFSGIVADGEAVNNGTDPLTGLPVYSLYGDIREPTAEMLSGLDVLVVDFQDVGVRFYTYLSTLFYVLKAAGKRNLPVIVLDRPNPINGLQIEGPLIAPGFESFIGIAPDMPIRHGMTMAEMALFFNQEYSLAAPLTVVPMQGWAREMWFDETGLPWVPPSPAMPGLHTATVYPGTCFFEGANLSEGRGTALPFELIGAPWMDGRALAQRMNALDLPGVRFRQASFHPSASKHSGIPCAGVQVHVTSRNAFQPVAASLHLVASCIAQAKTDFAFLDYSWEARPCHFDLLAGDSSTREHLTEQRPVQELIESWQPIQRQFAALRKQYLIY